MQRPLRRHGSIVTLGALSVLAFLLGPSMADAQGGGGTATPPPNAVAPFSTPTLPDPVFSVPTTTIHGFADTGFIQNATVDADNTRCPNTTDPHRFGGTLTVNGGTVVIPCNLVVQMPANTLTWADFVNGGPSLALGTGYPSFEARVVGNMVGPTRIAGLVFVSQLSVHAATGVITSIDYSTGNLLVDTGDPANPTVVQINDPNGRFGRAQSPDPRFSVDDANPTVHAATGYPMCVPRTDPAVTDDPLCPQHNRPNLVPVTVNGAQVAPLAGGCRNFSVSGIALPVSGELNPPAAGQAYCTQFVMKSVAARAAGDPDPTQQVPFEVGDAITFSGTLIKGAGGPDYISAHTIEANVGVYTMPGTQPSYLAIGEFSVGTADPNLVAVNGVVAETKDRLVLEAETTDVKTPVDIYMMDINPVTGAVRNRWVTPYAMTGENNGPLQANGIDPIGGGITTQNTGAQPQRARIRANKAPLGLLSDPTRTIRVAVRSLCTPQAPVNDAQGNPVLTDLDTCLNKNDATNQVANGLVAGQYFAPTFDFIFPENVKPGDPLVPNDFWHLGFLRYGEGAVTPSGVTPPVGPLEPAPWGGPSATVPGAPTIGAATAGDTTATVNWTAPASDGGAPLTGFTVTAFDAANNVAGAVTVDPNATSATVTGLTNGQTYQLQVVATNLLGSGPPSALSDPVTPVGPPAAPVNAAAAAGVRSLTVNWAAPATDGGAAITGFNVTATDVVAGTQVATTVPATARTATLNGLANGTTFQVKVVAVNAEGEGPAALTELVTTPAVPGAPTVATPVAHIRSISVGWTASVPDGVPPITGFTVSAARTTGGAPLVLHVADTARTATFTGLPNGASYRIRVTASNIAGDGLASVWSSVVTTPNVPAAARITTAYSGLRTDRVVSATATWLPPTRTGGSVITGYRVTAYRYVGTRMVWHKTWATLRPTTRALKFTGLAAGGTYRFRVQAVNAVGVGAPSGYSRLVTAL